METSTFLAISQRKQNFEKLRSLWMTKENETVVNPHDFVKQNIWEDERRFPSNYAEESTHLKPIKIKESCLLPSNKLPAEINSSLERMSISESISESGSSSCDCPELTHYDAQGSSVGYQHYSECNAVDTSMLDDTPFIYDDENNNLTRPLSSRAKRCGVKRRRANAFKHSVEDPQSPGEMEHCLGDTDSFRFKNNESLLTARNSFPRRNQKTNSMLAAFCRHQHAHERDSDLSRCDSIHVCISKTNDQQRAFRYDDFCQEEILGQGFFGKAVKVTHRLTREVMVLKVLNSFEPAMEKSFLQEVKMMRKLHHPNIIHFLGVVYENEHLSIITEYVDGGTLKDLILNLEKDLPWESRVKIARDISSGMFYLHSKKMIHRDLNSGNCFVKSNGTVVVADFGLARLHLANTSSERRRRYTVVGNPYCMAPEMLRGKQYNEKVDVFSFGVMLCELIGRIDADPDYLPRSHNFGIAVTEFYAKYCQNCPPFYFAIAVNSTTLDSNKRPSFEDLVCWFDIQMIRGDAIELLVPPDLRNLIASTYKQYKLLYQKKFSNPAL